MVRFVNVSNPAAFGVEWTAGDHDNRYQLVNPRGTTGLMFGASYDKGPWLTTPVIDPERFGLTTPPRSFGEFRKIAEQYVS